MLNKNETIVHLEVGSLQSSSYPNRLGREMWTTLAKVLESQ